MKRISRLDQRREEILKGILQLDVEVTREGISKVERNARDTLKQDLQENIHQ